MTKKPDKQTEQDKKQFADYLAGDSPVSRAYREADTPVPPAALDHAILNEAKAALQPKPRSFLDWDMDFWRTWARPVSTVVVMGVSLTIVMQVMEIGPANNRAMLDTPDTAIAGNSSSRPEALRQDTSPDSENEKQLAEQAMMAKPSAARSEFSNRMQIAGATESADNIALSNESVTATRMREQNLTAKPPELSEQETTLYSAMADPPPAATAANLADNAMEEWTAGAKPSAEVWLAGIDALEIAEKSAVTAYELAKMAQHYPEQVEQYRQQKDAFGEVQRDSAASADSYSATSPSIAAEQVTTAEQSLPALPHPDIWATGIRLLYRDDSEKLTAERAKLLRIYPEYVWQ